MTLTIADEFTHRLLNKTGLQPGMRVLDIGCGQGIVTRLIADRVGAQGAVIGVDISPKAIQSAQIATDKDAYPQVSFQAIDLDDADKDIGLFDAIIGRRVLMYLPNIVESLRYLHRHLKPAGSMVFQEHDDTGTPVSAREIPTHAKLHGLMWETVKRESPSGRRGLQLAAAFAQAGIEIRQVICEANIITPTQTPDLPLMARMMAPRMEEMGVARAEDLQLDRLAELLAHERNHCGLIIWEHIFGFLGQKAETL